MSSHRKKIIDRIEARCKTIRIGVEFIVNGVTHVCLSDIGTAVFVRRIAPLDESELMALTIRDTEAATAPIAGGMTEYSVLFALDCLYRNDDGTKAEQAARDVLAAIGSDPYWDDGAGNRLAENSTLDSADLDVQLFDDMEAGFSIPVRIKYQVPNWTL